MPGIVVTFRLDLLSFRCFIPAKGTKPDIVICGELNHMPVKVALITDKSPGIKKPDEQEPRYFYNKVSVAITRTDVDLIEDQFVVGRARYLLMELLPVVVEAINRVIQYCKYVKRHPNLREIGVLDLLDQRTALWNPDWRTLEGDSIHVSDTPLSSDILVAEGIGLLQPNLFGIEPVMDDEGTAIEHYFQNPPPIALSDQLLTDAQGAAWNGNIRRAVLELAITIEVFVKNKFFQQGQIAGAAFEYLEDKGRETVKVIELLDGAANYAFGESYKAAFADAYRHIDHVFRCRNKVAHRGEARFRDDHGTWHEVDQERLRLWWDATLHMFAWLTSRTMRASP